MTMPPLPQTMQAVFIRRYGKSDVLEAGPQPLPRLKPGQVLVRVRASAVNPRDWLIREGRYVFGFLMRGFPLILGGDLAGEVAALGSGVKDFQIGDRVFGMQTITGRMGAHAQYCAIDADALARLPDNVGYEEGAAAPCAAMTAWRALKHIGKVGPGSRVVINGASGGVGSYAVQIARALGAHVIAVTSTANLDFVRSLGADEIIDYKTESVKDKVRDANVFFDVIGRESLAKTQQCLAPGGRYITTIPGPGPLRESLLSRIVGQQGKTSHIVLVRAFGNDLEQVATLMAQGKVKSVIEQVYPLTEIRQAHDRSRSWRVRGKLVLRID